MDDQPAGMGRKTRWRRWHLATGLALAIFAIPHVAGQLAAVAGAEGYRAVNDLLRSLYRQPWIEPILLATVGVHFASGAGLLFRQKTASAPARSSGAALLLFLPVHLGGVLLCRHAFGLDSGFEFAAVGLQRASSAWFFAPYYIFATTALGLHLGSAVARRRPSARPVVGLALACGLAGGVLIVAALAGAFGPVSVAPAYYRLLGSEVEVEVRQ
ncbi:MAG: hypothetical protein KDH15_04780 [Rhodocyclaceae bacterium]|nr:hypothetical protein [Rhodocyclaceae bacterium]